MKYDVRHFFFSFVCTVFIGTNVAFSQDTTVEQNYLNSVEDVLIYELARADARDTKTVALQYIESAISAGKVTESTKDVLTYLAGEGVLTQISTNGRISNNYPDIRIKACELLGKIKSEESKNILLKVLLVDNEPAVITSAIRSLGEIGYNDNNTVASSIAWVQKKNAALNPSNTLALESLLAYEKLISAADSMEAKQEVIKSISLIATNPNYITPVRNKAYALLDSLSGNSSNK